MSKETACVATFVAAAGALDAALPDAALAAAGPVMARRAELAPEQAMDLFFSAEPERLPALRAALEAVCAPQRVDVVVQPAAGRRKALLVADMDSTMIGQECIDELADALGIRDHVAAITEQAMRGEIAFEGALRARVALLAGLRHEVVEEIIATRITATPGAATLVAVMRAHGAHTALVSGGFTLFTGPVAARLGFDETRANRLVVARGALTGAIEEPILGAAAKRAALEEMRAARGLAVEQTLAVGDGANDLAMLAAAGLGVAYRAKPKVAQAAAARIDVTDLTTLLFAQGFCADEFGAARA